MSIGQPSEVRLYYNHGSIIFLEVVKCFKHFIIHIIHLHRFDLDCNYMYYHCYGTSKVISKLRLALHAQFISVEWPIQLKGYMYKTLSL